MESIEKIKRIADTIDGFLSFTEEKFLYNAAKRASKKGVIVEIGSFKGKSTVWLAKGTSAGKKVKVYAVDPHISNVEHKDKQSSFPIFKNNLKKAGVTKMVTPVVARAEEFVKEWNQPISFLWIDGDHTYKGAKQDFDFWYPYVIEGGVIAFHDSTYEDVQEVVAQTIFGKGFKDAGVADSISYATKARHAKWLDFLHSQIILYFVNYSHNIARLFVPNNSRTAVKNFLSQLGLTM